MSNTDPDQLRADIEQTRSSLSRDVNALGDSVAPRAIAKRQAGKVSGAASGLKDKVMGTAQDAVSESGSQLKAQGEDVSQSAQDKAAMARQKTKGNPLAAGLIALGAGWLASSLLPSTQREREAALAAKQKAEPLAQEAQSVAQEAATNLQEPARDAAESVRGRAQQAAETVRGEGQQAGEDITAEAREAKESVQESRQ